MSHLPSCPAWGGAQLQVWTPGRPSLVLSISFSLDLGSRIERMCVCALEGKEERSVSAWSLQPNSTREPQMPGCDPQDLTGGSALQPNA